MHGSRLLVAGLALFLITFSVRVGGLPARGGTQAAAAVPESDYVGSQACARCHQDDYDHWQQSLHVRMTKPIAEATPLGDFSGARLSAHDRRFEFATAGDKPVIKIAFGDRAAETFSVDYTLGFKRYQGYLSMLPDGRMYVLPAFWHTETRRWLDWKEITPVPDGAHDFRQIWNSNCFNCHATNLAQGFNAQTQTYRTTWTEMGIGCEACHGPGRRHIAVIDAAQKDPSLKPGGTLDIFTGNESPRQTFDTCAYCHGNKQNTFVGFTAGSRYEDFALPFLLSAPIPSNDLQGEYWPDGRPNRFNRSQALMQSGCFKAGAVACTNCHVAHGSPYPYSLRVDVTKGADGDQLCTQCHAEVRRTEGQGFRPGLPGGDRSSGQRTAEQRSPHTFHAPDSEGSRCINCHMSDVNWRLLIRRRDHTFAAPVPEMTAKFGVPNACTTCHDDQSPDWAAAKMDEWWGDRERRDATVSVATTMYRAGSGDASVLSDLARLAIDRSQNVIIRASAVEFMQRLVMGTTGYSAESDGRSQTSFAEAADRESTAAGPGLPSTGLRPGTPQPAPRDGAAAPAPVRAELTHQQVNALIAAAADPEPMVRAHAIHALLAGGPRERIITPIVARLIDPTRIVRARAAEALLALGISSLPGAAGEALAKAQDDMAQATRDFPDIPENHTALGWLELEREHYAEAEAALDMAVKMNPRAARPLVLRGVMAARQERFDAARQWWEKAKALEPGYPNIDALIAEAEKRKGARR